MTNQVLAWDESILSVMMVDSCGTVLGHGLRDDFLDAPLISTEVPVTVPVLSGRMLVFLRLASRGLAASVYARVSEFFSIRTDYIAA